MLYKIHQRLVTLEEDNKKLNARFDKKDKNIEDLKGIIEFAKKETTRSTENLDRLDTTERSG